MAASGVGGCWSEVGERTVCEGFAAVISIGVGEGMVTVTGVRVGDELLSTVKQIV